MAEQNSDRQQFSANSQTNPKEHCKFITTRSRKAIDKFIGENLVVEEESLPEKTKYSGSFTIPIIIGELSVGKALLDLGASINLMPLSMLKRIGDLEIKPTRMTLQLADRSIKYPYGVAEDVLVKVDGLVIPVDFFIMDIEEDKDVPLILGRPFMRTAQVIVDVDDGKLKARVEDQEVNFNVFEAMQHLRDKQHCFRVDVIEDLFMLDDIHLNRSIPLEKVLRGDLQGSSMEEDKMIKTCFAELDTPYKVVSNQNCIEELGKLKTFEAPKVEFKILPLHLKYVFLEEGGQNPVIISNTHSCDEEQLLIGVLKKNAEAISWTLTDLC
ncbi:PREDICTED: uncharacterized protein LOC109353915 [Lupinus angustifolius]|uniref:uncharacterized protein LOC109353915 n=1 Tax=Lupinus angustifolius TaxID=3871 RepID=UPI00092F671F|nr:PREDICTED: uncharacterized protein LOC109353915 [Lupinus angustifolius]